MKPDLAHELTDQELSALEKRIAAEYKKAADELTDKINAYFESFKKRDAETKALIGTIVNGREYTEKDYQQWRLAQIGRGKRFEALRDRIAERMTNANEVAAAYINDNTPSIYSLNRNYAAYTIEQVAGDVGFDLWDEQTVRRLIVEQPDLMPYYPPERAVKRGIDLAYRKRQIAAQVTSGILQGESIKHLADRLQTNIQNMNRDSAIRAARTAVTGAQNAGRQDSYDAAVKMGIEMEKQWLATLDGRTRHDHAAADGQTVAEDKPFRVGGYELMYPGDPRGPGHEIYNCRCSMIAKVKGVEMSGAKRWARNPETGKSTLIENMTYPEWAGWKEKQKYKAMPQGYRRQFMRSQEQQIDSFRFSPAKTQEKAVEYMSQITKAQGPVNIGKGVTLEQENAINMALTDVYQRYRVKLDIRKVTHANGNYQAAYNPQSKTLSVKGNKATWERNAQKGRASGFLASDDPYQVFYHELGHALWEELPTSAKNEIESIYRKYSHEAYEKWKALGGSVSGKGQSEVFAERLSKYGHQDKYEFFSECFAQIMTDQEDIAAYDVSEIIERVFKGAN